MNGTELDIQVVKPFTDAVELTRRILFSPFDLKKWLVIGFAAWLAHIGGGFNFKYKYDRSGGVHPVGAFHGLAHTIHGTPSWIVILVTAVLILLFVVLCLLLIWLRARGRFMFIDCVVRNRAAIAEPWREFRRLGNSFFLISLLVGSGFLLVATVIGLPVILLIRYHHHDQFPNVFLLCLVLVLAVVVFVLGIAWVLIAHLMIPIMYRRRIPAWAAVREAIALIGRYPDAITFYCLFWILLGVASLMIGCLTVCLTCCVAAIPYVGTVILLPMYVSLRGFGLLFLKQFGSDYDVWAGVSTGSETASQPPPLPTA